MKILLAAPFLTFLHLPKSTTTNLFQSPHLWRKRRSRSRGVAKINFGTPMLHGALFYLSSAPSVGVRFSHLTTPPQRECDFCIFSTPPQRESKKSTESHLEAMVWMSRSERREKQIDTKTSPTPVDCDWDVFSNR